MNDNAHPILAELSRQLPVDTQTLKRIRTGDDFESIAAQAKAEIVCLENLSGVGEDGRPSKTVLAENGYGDWLADCEDNDRLRVLGALKLIAELAEELAEE